MSLLHLYKYVVPFRIVRENVVPFSMAMGNVVPLTQFETILFTQDMIQDIYVTLEYIT